MSEAMAAEFDTVAAWTAEVALELGAEYYVPAGCRGSGSPSALGWLSDVMALSPRERMLDAGAGVGGPAAFVADRAGVRPLLVEPEAGAGRASVRLFDLPVLRADATALPLRSASVDAAWCLGVLCTTNDQLTLLAELRRVLRPSGRLGMLVFTASRNTTRFVRLVQRGCWPRGAVNPRSRAGYHAGLSPSLRSPPEKPTWR